MATVRGQRLRMLEGRNAGITQLAAWVEQNRHMFKGPVFGPLACEVAVADPVHATYLEQQCQCARSARRPAASLAKQAETAAVKAPAVMGVSGNLLIATESLASFRPASRCPLCHLSGMTHCSEEH